MVNFLKEAEKKEETQQCVLYQTVESVIVSCHVSLLIISIWRVLLVSVQRFIKLDGVIIFVDNYEPNASSTYNYSAISCSGKVIFFDSQMRMKWREEWEEDTSLLIIPREERERVKMTDRWFKARKRKTFNSRWNCISRASLLPHCQVFPVKTAHDTMKGGFM